MYAVLESGGKQHKVVQGDKIRVEKLDAKVGDKVTLGPVLFVGGSEKVHLGDPHLASAKVTAEVLRQGRGKKITTIKKKKRKGYRKKQGHRQYFTEVEIKGIEVS